MRRLFYVALGATAGVLIVRRLSRVAQNLTPEGMAKNVDGAFNRVGEAIADFIDDVREGMAERETELYDQLGINDGADGAARAYDEREATRF